MDNGHKYEHEHAFKRQKKDITTTTIKMTANTNCLFLCLFANVLPLNGNSMNNFILIEKSLISVIVYLITYFVV